MPFDAAVAAASVEAVVAPRSCGIGGYAATGIGFLAKTAAWSRSTFRLVGRPFGKRRSNAN